MGDVSTQLFLCRLDSQRWVSAVVCTMCTQGLNFDSSSLFTRVPLGTALRLSLHTCASQYGSPSLSAHVCLWYTVHLSLAPENLEHISQDSNSGVYFFFPNGNLRTEKRIMKTYKRLFQWVPLYILCDSQNHSL